MKKLLKESQAKTNILNTECSKLQNQNQILEQSLKKSEVHFTLSKIQTSKSLGKLLKDYQSNKSKLKSQLFLTNNFQSNLYTQFISSSEMDKIRDENGEHQYKLKENYDKIKKQTNQLEETVQQKEKVIIEVIRQSLALLNQNRQNIFGENTKKTSSKVASVICKNMEQILDILPNQNYKGSSNIEDSLDQMKTAMIELEKENYTLKKKTTQLEQDLDEQNKQSNDLLPRYREQMEKLKLNMNQMLQSQKEKFQSEIDLQLKKSEDQKEGLKLSLIKMEQQTNKLESELEEEKRKYNRLREKYEKLQDECADLNDQNIVYKKEKHYKKKDDYDSYKHKSQSIEKLLDLERKKDRQKLDLDDLFYDDHRQVNFYSSSKRLSKSMRNREKEDDVKIKQQEQFQMQSDQKSHHSKKSGKKIKKQIQDLDNEIIEIQQTLEKELAKLNQK